MDTVPCRAPLDDPVELTGRHVTDQQEVRRDLLGQEPHGFDQDFDALARPVIGRAADDEGIGRYPDRRQIRRFRVVPLELVSLVDADRARCRHPEEPGAHREEMIPDRVTDADDPVDSGVQVAHPRHGVEKTHGADDAAVGDDLDGQAATGAQAVGDCLVVERVHDVEPLFHEELAQPGDVGPVEVLPERHVDDRHRGLDEDRVVRVVGRTDHRHLDPPLVHADEGGDGRSVGALGDAQGTDGHRRVQTPET